MTDAEVIYSGMMMEVMKLRKQLRELRTQKVLMRLAAMKQKNAYVNKLEEDLGRQLSRMLRDNERIEVLLEMLEDLV